MYLQQPPALAQAQYKMDILFYNSIKKAKRGYNIYAIFHFLKALILIIFLPIDVINLETDSDMIVTFMGVAIALSLVNVLINQMVAIVGYGDNRQNNEFFLTYAAMTQHAVTNEPLENSNMQNLEDCVSKTMYNQINMTNVNSQGLTNQLKSTYESMLSSQIDSLLMKNRDCLSLIDFSGKVMSLGVLIFGIVALAQGNPSTAQLVVCIIYLVLEALSIWKILLIILAIALCPLLTCMLCIVVIFCPGININARGVNMPETVKATPEIIAQTDGSCVICLQNFNPNQDVIILPCSKKHVFHSGCISNWTDTQPTCPICRYEL